MNLNHGIENYLKTLDWIQDWMEKNVNEEGLELFSETVEKYSNLRNDIKLLKEYVEMPCNLSNSTSSLTVQSFGGDF